jgi:hypothetical protein
MKRKGFSVPNGIITMVGYWAALLWGCSNVSAFGIAILLAIVLALADAQGGVR